MQLGPIFRAARRNKARASLIVLDVALTLAIVVNCVSFIQDARKDLARSSGFDDENIVSVSVRAFDTELDKQDVRDNQVQADLDVLRAMPGVKAVSSTRFRPWQGGGSSTMLRVLGSKGEQFRTQIYNADEGFFDAIGGSITEGRGFAKDFVLSERERMKQLFATARERSPSGRAVQFVTQEVVMTRALGNLLFPDGKILGQRLEDDDGDQYLVVGVLEKFYNPYGWPIHEYSVFFPNYSGMAYLVRAEPGQLPSVMKGLEKTLIDANKGRNITMSTIADLRVKNQGQNRFLVVVLSIVIGLLVFVTALGVIGITSFSVAERTRQIGTRRALGASKADILRYFLAENWMLTSFGIGLGIVLAYVLNAGLVQATAAPRLGIELVFVGVLLMWATGFLATLMPALRGTRIAPAIATRNV